MEFLPLFLSSVKSIPALKKVPCFLTTLKLFLCTRHVFVKRRLQCEPSRLPAALKASPAEAA